MAVPEVTEVHTCASDSASSNVIQLARMNNNISKIKGGSHHHCDGCAHACGRDVRLPRCRRF